MTTHPAVGNPASRRWLMAAVWAIYIVAALICLGYLLSDLHDVVGRRAFIYGTLFALLPVPFLAAAFIFLDRLRPPPVQLMLVAFIWGSCIATLIALRVNGWVSGAIGGVGEAAIRDAVFIAPWVEESAKGLALFVIVWSQRNHITSAIDGVVYGGLVGVGFAFVENIVYYSQVFQQNLAASRDRGLALDAVQQLFWWRGVAAPFVHPMFTLLTGLGIGIAVRYRNVGVRVIAPVAGFLGAVLLHMSYNTLASYATHRALTAVYIGILLPTLIVVALAIILVRGYERRVVAARLHDYVMFGWVDKRVWELVSSRSGRTSLKVSAAAAGPGGVARAKQLQRAAIELGTVRDLVVRGVAGPAERARELDLATTVRRLTPGVLPPVPTDASAPGAWALGVCG